jgi:hypothetical protein
MEKRIKDLSEKIIARRQEIWDEEPEELRVLKRTKFPNSNSFASVMYAYAEIYHMTKNLYLYRNIIGEEEVAFKEAMKLLSAYLDGVSKRYTTWKLADSAKLVAETAETIKDTGDPQEMKELLDELLIYNNKLFVWLDSSIPWFQLGKTIEFD